MSNILASAMQNEANKKFTENGCEAYKSTTSSLLDMFATIGALRERPEEDIKNILDKACAEDLLTATRTVFYGRDIRGGCGERKTFRIMLRHLAKKHPEAVKPNVSLVGYYGRFDDLYTLIGTPCEADMWKYMKEQINTDLQDMEDGQSISLLAKWLKSADATSKESKRLGILTAKNLGYSVYDYKRVVRKLRKYIRIVEQQMCQNDWNNIDYSAVPSRAMMIYKRAFNRHSPEHWNSYIQNLVSGEEKVNASTLYPYDLVEQVYKIDSNTTEDTLNEEQWKALPNYVKNADGTPFEGNIVVMADVSGSMTGRPMNTAIGLAIYFAERCKGAFHNLYMTFESKPRFCSITEGASFRSNVDAVKRAPWGGSTNFAGAMRALLDLAVRNNVPASEMPVALVCVSDMEFDTANRRDYYRTEDESWSVSLMDTMRKEYEEKGYNLPKIVFWNAFARNDTFHINSISDKGALLVSGQSASTFKSIIDCLNKTPYEAMLAVVNSERYQFITVGDEQ